MINVKWKNSTLIPVLLILMSNIAQAHATNEQDGCGRDHNKYLRGMTCAHVVKTQSQVPGLPPTLENASSIPTLHTDSAGPISITELVSSVQTFVPEAEGTWCITIASQVKLRAPQHNQNIASATAHPNLWKRPRCNTKLSVWAKHLTLKSIEGSISCAGTKERWSKEQVATIHQSWVHMSQIHPNISQVRASKPRHEHHAHTHSKPDINIRIVNVFKVRILTLFLT